MNDATAVDHEEELWETFHANSRVTRGGALFDDAYVAARMARMPRSLRYEGYPVVELPDERMDFGGSLTDALRKRRSAIAEDFHSDRRIDLAMMANVLRHAFGESHATAGGRPARTAPSGGALFPMEVYVYPRVVDGIEEGLYHYSPPDHHLRRIRRADRDAYGRLFVQPAIAEASAMTIFIAALFERSTFKYGDRGYRFCLLEAGHMAQNLALIMAALDLPCLPTGGYFDYDVDRFIGCDGVGMSVVYALQCGGTA